MTYDELMAHLDEAVRFIAGAFRAPEGSPAYVFAREFLMVPDRDQITWLDHLIESNPEQSRMHELASDMRSLLLVGDEAVA